MQSDFHKPQTIAARAARYGLTAAALLAVLPATADEFYLSSGKVVRGAVASQTATEYVLQTEFGTIKINKADVTRTVEQGTTTIEVEGDIARSKGNLTDAYRLYSQALQSVPMGSLAAGRLQTKVAEVSQNTQAAHSTAIVAKFNQAQALIANREYDSAQAILTEIAPMVSPTDPLSSNILRMTANIHYGKGLAAKDAVRLEIARQELEEAIAADPAFYPAYFALSDMLLSNSATIQRGIELMEQGLTLAGDRLPEQQRYNYQYLLAGKYFDQGNYAKAAAMYAELIPAREKYPAYADALDRTVESYIRMGEENLSSDFRETITNLNIALKLNPTNQKALFLLGRIYLDLGEIENAIVTLKRLVELESSYEEANHYLGRAYFQAKDYDSALQHLTAEIEAHPGNYFTLVDRAEVYIAMENYTAAQADLEAAKAIDATHWFAYYLTALQAFHQKNYENARAALMEALDRKRNAMPVHLLMGQVLMQQNQTDGARQWFEQVNTSLENVENLSYRFQVHRAEALTRLGEISIKQNSPRQAVNYLSQALELLPSYAPAMVAMAEADLLLSNDTSAGRSRAELFKEAEDLYLKAVAQDPENPEYYQKIGTFYHRYQVDFDKARKYYNLYVDKGGEDVRVNSWLVAVGGTERPELITTTTASTVGTTGSSVLTSAPLAMTATTATATMMMPGMTTGTVTMTTETMTVLPTGAPVMPGMTPVVPVPPAVPGAVPALTPAVPQ